MYLLNTHILYNMVRYFLIDYATTQRDITVHYLTTIGAR